MVAEVANQAKGELKAVEEVGVILEGETSTLEHIQNTRAYVAPWETMFLTTVRKQWQTK